MTAKGTWGREYERLPARGLREGKRVVASASEESDFTRFRRDVARGYELHIVEPGKQPQFFLLDSFLLTFTSVRLITHAIKDDRFKRVLHNVKGPGGVHIHHMVPGIIMTLTFGYLGVSEPEPKRRSLHALGFGAGAALTLDEFALWLNLQDVYWEKQGRRSIDAVVVAGTVMTIGLTGAKFWLHTARAVGRAIGRHA